MLQTKRTQSKSYTAVRYNLFLQSDLTVIQNLLILRKGGRDVVSSKSS